MMIPAWILDIFAAIMLVVAALSASRLAIGRLRPDADIDAAHTLMGVAMAGSLVGSLHTLPGADWVVVFAVVTAWFAWRVTVEVRAQGAAALGTGHHLPHLVHGAAMVYMFAAMTTAAHGSGMGPGGMAAGSGSMGTLKVPTLGFVFILFMAAWAVWDLDQVGSAHLHRRGVARLPQVNAASRPFAALATASPGVVSGSGPAAAPTAAGAQGASPAPAGDPGNSLSPDTFGSDAAARLLDPRVAVGCRIAMGISMAFMLVIML
jgi:Domain of unknown function (DUF5134)